MSLQVVQLLVKLYQKMASPDYLSICQCLMFLNDPEGVAEILEKLLLSDDKVHFSVHLGFNVLFFFAIFWLIYISPASQDDELLAFQIAFDLVENEHQAFQLSVKDRLQISVCKTVALANKENIPESTEVGIDGSNSQNGISSANNLTPPNADVQADVQEDAQLDVQADAPSNDTHTIKLEKIKDILSGATSIKLTLQFLYTHNR